MISARDVVFNEGEFYFKRNMAHINSEIDEEKHCDKEMENDETCCDEEIENEEMHYNEDIEKEILEKNQNRSRRVAKLPKKYNDYELYMAFNAISFIQKVPNKVEELKDRDDERFWREAMNREISAIEKNKTWREVTMQDDVEILETKWVFALKPLEKDIKDKFKARLVVRGFAQINSFDYDGIYSPIARMTTLRTLLSVGNQFKYYFK